MSLYQRLGGYDALVAVTDDIFARLMEDPQLYRFFVGHGTDSKTRIEHLFVNRICVSFGGPCFYAGRGLMMAHAGLGITQDDWQSMVKHLNATLDKFKVPGKEKQEVLSIVSGFKSDIVEK